MKTKQLLFSYILLSIALFSFACSSGSDDSGTIPKENEESTDELDVNYVFRLRGANTVDLGESKDAIIDFRNLNNQLNSTVITDWSFRYGTYKNDLEKYVATTFPDTEKQRIRVVIDSLLQKDLKYSKKDVERPQAQRGVPSYINVSNEGQRLIDSLGVELGQVIQKALMGMLCLDRMYYYLEESQKVAFSTPVPGRLYTQKQHYWDTAYGYLGRTDIDKTRGNEPLFLANYIEKEAVGMKGLEKINEEIYASFVRGRKAIVALDEQAVSKEKTYIETRMKDMFYKRTEYYLDESKVYLNSMGNSEMPDENYFHSMAEAIGFIYALPALKKEDGTRYLTFNQAHTWITKLLSGTYGVWDKDHLLASSRQEGSINWTIEQILDIFEP